MAELRLRLLSADLEEEDDGISSYRRREAAWISLATHAVVILLLLFVPKWTSRQPVIVPYQEKQPTFLTLPDDALKVKNKPKTDILSDKDRIAQSRTPSVDKDTLRKLLDARRPGPPKPQAPPAPPAQQAQQQNPATAQAAPPAQPSQPPPVTSQVQTPAPTAPSKSPFTIASPGSSVSQAIQQVASGHPPAPTTYGGGGGEYGNATHPRAKTNDPMEILSDTLGVDFGPYMKRLHYTVQSHWDPLIPESAMPPVMKKGVVVIQFSITKDGRVEGMKLVSSSGDVALDRAAWGAITDAIPLPNLPLEFTSDYLTIRARFYYNPDKNELE
ncbi:MAG TPA: energy transducer TonB [Candidatus Angelobacter sp.]|nr:energy transducer TonB [Candidatus Angelobacter sp.]